MKILAPHSESTSPKKQKNQKKCSKKKIHSQRIQKIRAFLGGWNNKKRTSPTAPLRMQVQEPNAVTKGHMKLKMTLVELPLIFHHPKYRATRKLPGQRCHDQSKLWDLWIYTQCHIMKECHLKKGPFQNQMFIEPNQQFFLRAGSSFSGELRSDFGL